VVARSFPAEDDKDDPGEGLAATRRLVEQDNVFAFVGNSGVAGHPAAWEYLNEKGIPDLLVAGGIYRFYADPVAHPWTVSAIPDYRLEGQMYGEYISQNFPGKKVGMLYANHEGGLDGLAGLKAGLDSEKNELVSEESFELTDIEVFSPVQTIQVGRRDSGHTRGPGPTIRPSKRPTAWDGSRTPYSFSTPTPIPLLFMSVVRSSWKERSLFRPCYRIGGRPLRSPSTTDHANTAALRPATDYLQSGDSGSGRGGLSRTCDNLTRKGSWTP
jgi:hypothetical protein